MNKPSSGIENEKNKETKETSETDSYEDYKQMQNAEEGMGEDWFSETGLPPIPFPGLRPLSDSECETVESSLKNSYEERKEALLREKWYTVTGRKPRNIPRLRMTAESPEGFTFFGERKQNEVEKQREGKILLAAKRLQALNIHYGKVRQEIRLQSLNQGLMCIKFSSNGNLLAFSERHGGIEVFSIKSSVREVSTGKLVTRLKTQEQNLILPIRTLAFHPKDCEKLYSGGDCGIIRACNAKTGALLEESKDFDLINVMDFNLSGDLLATGGRAGRVHVIDANTLQSIWTRGCSDLDNSVEPSVNDDFHRMRIYGLRFHPTEQYLFATGGWDRTVKVWDTRTPKAIRSLYGPAIYGCALDISDNTILTASWRAEKSISLWDFSTGEMIKNFSIHNKSIQSEGEFLYAAKFFKNYSVVNNNMIAVGGSGFPEMLVINIFTEKVDKYFPSYKAILTLDIFQNLIAYGGKESVLRIAEIPVPVHRLSRWGPQNMFQVI